MTSLSAILHQQSPLEQDIFGDGQNALLEHWPQSVGEPFVQFSTAPGITDRFDAETDLCERDGADIKQIKRLRADKGDDLRFGSRPAKFGEYVRVKQPTCHKITSRTGRRSRLGSISMSRRGEACKTSTRAFPVGLPCRRRNSSAETRTTASRPCTVTSWGPSVLTRRTSSLKRALASCRSHRPEPGWSPRRLPSVFLGGLLFLVMLTRLQVRPKFSRSEHRRATGSDTGRRRGLIPQGIGPCVPGIGNCSAGSQHPYPGWPYPRSPIYH
jgi:hypothetical protein